MIKKAQWVLVLIGLGLGGLFSIEVFADESEIVENAGYGTIAIDQRVQAELDQISDAESSGQITAEKAQQLRQEVEAILQEEENTQLPLMQFQSRKIFRELNAAEEDIQGARGY